MQCKRTYRKEKIKNKQNIFDNIHSTRLHLDIRQLICFSTANYSLLKRISPQNYFQCVVVTNKTHVLIKRINFTFDSPPSPKLTEL